ncbi:MAG: arylesterase [Desulfobacter sp.]|nr:MAG: arylesterase [Desulfobacter sp.]
MTRVKFLIIGCIFAGLSLITGFSTAGQVQVLFIGDSLTAGLGVMPEQAYPALIQERFNRWMPGRVKVVNGGASGATSAGAHARLKWYLRADPDILVLALGANDGLRGLPVGEMKKNLAKAIDLAKENHIRVVLCGMEVPPNYGPGYAADFRRVFPELAREYDVALVPFLLEGVGGQRRLNQADGIHPTPKGHRIIAETVFPYIKALL